MNFKNKILEYEFEDKDSLYVTKIGKLPVIITAVHTYPQIKKEKLKKSEIFTGAISKYVSNETDCSYYIKQKDNGVDSNSKREDVFKQELLDIIEQNKIKLLIDIHGAKMEHDFDIEIGTLNNTTIDTNLLKSLEEEFKSAGITNIKYNNPFMGGGITQYVSSNSNIDVMQLEINKKYRSNNDLDNVKIVCDSLINFIQKNYNIT